jgi:type 1 glutamine amidotransferase
MRLFTLLLTSVFALTAQIGFSADKIKVLIVDGVNNHNWKLTTAATKGTLLKSGRFDVDVSTSPDKKASKEEWEKWQPNFSKYEVVVSNFNDGGKTLWSKATQTAFESFVKNGGGFVPVHAADNSSGDWHAYNEMIAVGGWGGRKAGKSGSLLRLEGGKWKASSPDEGKSGSHGPQRNFMVVHDQPDHPILKGLPTEWMHAKDELYNTLRGPAKNVEVLAHSESLQSKTNEPMLMIISYGKGKVAHIPMGHYNNESCECVGFQTILARSTEYVATGKVTIGIPKNFPGKETPVVVNPGDLVWP